MLKNKLRIDNQIQDLAIAKYHVAINKHNSDGEFLWSRYNALLVFNSLLLTAVGFTYQSSTFLPKYFNLILPLVGLISCWLWYSMAKRGYLWTEFWMKQARKIEKKYLKDELIDTKDEFNPIINGNKFRKEAKIFPNVKIASYLLILLIGLIYLILLLHSVNIKLKPFNKKDNCFQNITTQELHKYLIRNK